MNGVNTSSFSALAVCGPTASGKSAVGVELAKQLNGEVLNVDSVQVYRGCDVGAAKLSVAEREGIPHHLLDLFDPSESGNVGRFRDEAVKVLGDVSSRGKLPILVGGSGMYLTVLLHGLAEVPPTDLVIRERVAAMLPMDQYRLLATVDPTTANRLSPNDTQRVSRAVEMWFATGKPPSEIFAAHQFSEVSVRALVLVLCRPREELYARINTRTMDMLDAGLVAETRGLYEKFGECAALDAIGYRQALEHIKGRLELGDLAPQIAQNTRRFAKRQMTYWRNEPSKRGWFTRPMVGEPGIRYIDDPGENGGLQQDSPDAADSKAGRAPLPSSRRRNRQGDVKGFQVFGFDGAGFGRAGLLSAVRERLASPLQSTEVWYISPDL